MNTAPNSPNDEKWQALLALSAPTFAGETVLPYGFVTSTVARLKGERGERELLERIGLRALFASLAILVASGGFTLGLQLQDRFDFDPGVNSILRIDDVPIA